MCGARVRPLAQDAQAVARRTEAPVRAMTHRKREQTRAQETIRIINAALDSRPVRDGVALAAVSTGADRGRYASAD